jgi:hypothetical protein
MQDAWLAVASVPCTAPGPGAYSRIRVGDRGMMLIVHSSLCQPAVTPRMLEEAGLKASVVARRGKPFGPVVSSRVAWLEDRKLIAAGQREEELVDPRRPRYTRLSVRRRTEWLAAKTSVTLDRYFPGPVGAKTRSGLP